MHIPSYDCIQTSCDYGNEKRQLSSRVAATTSTTATTLSLSTPTSTLGKFTVTGPITLTFVTTLTSLPGSVTMSPSISDSSSTPQETTVLIGSGDLITPTLSISSKAATGTSLLEIGSASSQLGVGAGPMGTSGRLSGTAILGIVLGAVVFLFIIALGLAFWRRRRSSNEVARQDATMTSEWMDRWEDSVRMRRSSNAYSTRSANASTPGVYVSQVQSQSRSPKSPSPCTKPRGSQKRVKKPYDSDTETKTSADTNTLTVQTSVTPSTSLPLSSSASTNTDRSVDSSPISPKVLTHSLNSDLRTPNKVTVMYTFVPHLPDELPVKIGDQLRVIREFDDGWALCVTIAHGKQGMVPVECLAVTGALERIREEVEPPDLDDARFKRNRGSSLEPLARA